MKQISTVECFAVCLVKSYHVLLSSEYFNLRIYISVKTLKKKLSTMTSSAVSGPLLVNGPCLVTDTNVAVSNVTASSVSVFLKIM